MNILEYYHEHCQMPDGFDALSRTVMAKDFMDSRAINFQQNIGCIPKGLSIDWSKDWIKANEAGSVPVFIDIDFCSDYLKDDNLVNDCSTVPIEQIFEGKYWIHASQPPTKTEFDHLKDIVENR